MKDEKIYSSEILKQFLDFIDEAKSCYDYNLEAMKNEDKATQDYLHMLELDELNCSQRSKIATKLMHNRQQRREYKDAVEELEPVIEFLNDAQNKKVINSLSHLLGQIRKVENYHKSRIYVPKVVDTKPIGIIELNEVS